MPICPIDGVQLNIFSEDVSAQAFWECPKHKGRYVSHGLAGLIPVPRAVIASPLEGIVDGEGKKAIISYYYDTNTKRVYLKLEGEDDWTLGGGEGGDLTYVELTAIGISAGQNNLTDSSWGVSKVRIDHVEVSVASGTVSDYEVAIYEKNTFLEVDKRYEVIGLDSGEIWEDSLDWNYVDDDGVNEVHLLITENAGGPGTYDVQIRGVKLV